MENIEGIGNYDEENINENTSFENDNTSFKNEGNIEQDKKSISINSIEAFLIEKDINILNPDENYEKECKNKEIVSGDIKFKFNSKKPKKLTYNEVKKDSKEKIYSKNTKKLKYH